MTDREAMHRGRKLLAERLTKRGVAPERANALAAEHAYRVSVDRDGYPVALKADGETPLVSFGDDPLLPLVRELLDTAHRPVDRPAVDESPLARERAAAAREAALKPNPLSKL